MHIVVKPASHDKQETDAERGSTCFLFLLIHHKTKRQLDNKLKINFTWVTMKE